ncbi:acetyl-CoA carboxylase biotin carboxylase subunit [Allokutzneria sp. A3M-2-11 16]|uniref:acetyl-CoA carboxylase biotin carboxylase subunit n=1 Tax=Allokutzneria sp. A3M-2-11 16 TaxID=2962043 RepID=UPI0020B8E738|nr:biotin carboxylase N-terminal domain-containing protein [Allokutzneria sp. A3M-2-11 16]MCP3800518.1 acetyl-CoA carboxylase biotin carboxylase subunit [Allokutzneria sp. A3M-2-11 16]
MFESVLVANRGEIARRVLRTARRLGIRTIAVHSDVDAGLPFVREADEAVLLGGAAIGESYRNAERVLEAARRTGAKAVHPGYGFLSENTDFARAVQEAGIAWVGPGAAAISAMGDKVAARAAMAAAGVPVAPGSADAVSTVDEAVVEAERVGYPVMIKASAGGGGMGMATASDVDGLRAEFEKVTAFAERTFGDGRVFVERFFPSVRHVEVQVLGLNDGRVIALGERDCSVQRRNQKVAEETPSPAVDATLRAAMCAAAVRAAEAVDYRNAGTVEFLLDPATKEFFFLEMNTRLQVEHPITEAIFGVDLVEEQLRVAAGLEPGFDVDGLTSTGHAIELRINAEDSKRFFPGPGAITEWIEPEGEGVRVDSGYGPDTVVTPNYDSLMAKLVLIGADRADALEKARKAVAGFTIVGPKSNLAFHAELLENPEFISGDYDTGIIGRMRAKPKK